MSNKNLTIGLIVVAIIAICGIFSPVGQNVIHGLGAAVDCQVNTCFTSLGVTGTFQADGAAIFNGTVTQAGAVSLTSTFKLGSSGTAQVNQVTTTCAMKGDVSIAATSTGYAFCSGVTGLTSADNVIAQFASTTGVTTQFDNWVIVSADASTTAGAVDLTLLNLTGAARTPSALSRIGSSTTLWIAH